MTSPIAADTRIMRGINAAAVLAAVRSSESSSVAAIASETGLSRQAVARALGMLAAGHLVEMLAPDPGLTRPGRPAQRVRFRPEAGHVLGVSVSPADVRLSVADLSGEERGRLALPHRGTDLIGVIRRGTRELLDSVALDDASIWSVVAGAPGIIDPVTGLITQVPSMVGLEGTVLIDALREQFACEVVVDNDVKLATEGQLWRTPHPVSSLVRIEWGERLGAGIVLNGSLYRGASNDAGDIGFLEPPVIPASHSDRGDGPFESWVGSAELLRLAREGADAAFSERLERLAPPAAVDAVLSAASDGLPAARDAVAELCRRLAVGLAAMRALLDPELIVIGGPMARGGEFVVKRLTAELSTRALNQPRLALCSLREDAVVLGAVHRGLELVQEKRLSASVLRE